MIFIYLLIVAGTSLGLWAVASLTLVGHLYGAVSLLGLVFLAGWSGTVFARRAPQPMALSFVCVSQALSLEIAGHMAGILPPEGLWVWVFFACCLALGPFFLDFVTRFPAPQPKLRWLVPPAFGLAITLAILGPLGLLGPIWDPFDPLAHEGRVIHFRGEAHSLYGNGPLLIAGGMQLIGLWILWRARRQVSSDEGPRVARQALIFALGTVIAWVPTISFLRGVLPPGLELFLHGPPALFFALIPVSGAVALTLPDFYHHGTLFRRLLIALGLVASSYLIYLALVHTLTMALDQVQPGFGYEGALFGSALVVALLIRPLQQWLAEWVDRHFFPHLLGFRTLLQEASQALATTIIPGDVARLATEALPARLGVSGATLLVLDESGSSLISLSGSDCAINQAHPIWVQALHAHGPAAIRQTALCAELGVTAPALMIPLRVGGHLVGIYLLGARPSEIAYTSEEFVQLKVLGHHLAIAVENGRSLQKIDALSQRAVAEVEERNRLAREIHDTIAQGLTAASLQLDVVEATLTVNPAKAAKATDRAQAIVRSNLVEARRSVLELRAPLLGTESLPVALNRLLKQAAVDISASGSFQIEGSYRGLPARIENQFYRIAQEALHNAVKYSSASHLTLILKVEEEQASLCVIDDGAGFDPAQVPPGSERGRFGLAGMGERVRLLKGRLRIESEPGEGTRIEAIAPLDEREGESA